MLHLEIEKVVPNKSFGRLLDISPKNFIFVKTLDLELSCIEEWFTDLTFNPLEIKDKMNITMQCAIDAPKTA